MPKIHLLVGVISMNNNSLNRLLESIKIIDCKRLEMDFLIFTNKQNYIKPPSAQNQKNIQYISLNNKLPLEISEARNFLHSAISDYCFNKKIHPIVWLLDEDMEIDARANDYLSSLDNFKRQGIDVLIGSIEGDSPNSAFSGMQVQLLDLLNNLQWLDTLEENNVMPNRGILNKTLRRKYPDYYYDTSSQHQGHLQEVFWIEPESIDETVYAVKNRIYTYLEAILSGKNIFRPIKQQKINEYHESLLKGGNTFILNLETLKIKNPVISINKSIIRRSDMLWALINREFFNKKLIKVDFTVIHHRQEKQSKELNIDKTIKEIYGSIIFNALKEFYDKKQEISFAEILQSHVKIKSIAIENSLRKILNYIYLLEQLNNQKLNFFCNQLRIFYTSKNLTIIREKIQSLTMHSEKIFRQFTEFNPVIKSYCDLFNIHGTLKQYDLGNDKIKVFSKKLIDKMDKNIIPFVRIHSACCNSEIFKATDCDCAQQLDESIKIINNCNNGILFYLDQEGRGHGYSKKISIIKNMQTNHLNTYDSCLDLGLECDIRDYQNVAIFLKKYGFTKIKLLSNNLNKQKMFNKYGIEIIIEKITGTYTHKNIDYLKSKQDNGGHKNLIITEIMLNKKHKKSQDIVNFYEKEDKYGEFSNFSNYPFVCDNKYWRTAEHYYQAQKFYLHPQIFNAIQKAKTPNLAKEIAIKYIDNIDQNWKFKKIPFMYNALYAKFTQDDDLRKLLLKTKEKYIVEKTKYDDFWGNGKNGQGKNILGKLLMHLRDEIQPIKI